VARIFIESDRGARMLSEKLVSANLDEADYAEKLVARMSWALSDAETADDERARESP
jgi:hypothetical protein